MKIPRWFPVALLLVLFSAPVQAGLSGQAIRAAEEEIKLWMRGSQAAGRSYGRMDQEKKSSGTGTFFVIVAIGCAGVALLKSLTKPSRRPAKPQAPAAQLQSVQPPPAPVAAPPPMVPVPMYGLPTLYIGKNGTQLGPFSDEQVRSMLQTGMLLPSDLVWHDGRPDWISLAQLYGMAPQ